MTRFIKSLTLVTLLFGLSAPAWSQASTEGKEFWVSSSIVCSPSDGKGIEPYIAVSAEKACTVKITGGVGNAINITQQVADGSWNEFGHNSKAEQTNPNSGLINVHMDASKWYPINTKEPATVCNLAGQKNMYGLHITATEKISVYVILGGDNAMDASNILPLTALGTEYYVQDYIPEAHNGDSWSTNEGNMVTVTTILGTENGTQVEITPRGTTYDGKSSTYTIDLNQGQTYYLISQKEHQLAGTHIVAKNDKKIAIYTGSPLTRLPNGISARDAMFEQPMPVEYWGTQFIVTRSLGKNGNIIGITASQNGTEIKLDGYSQGIFIDEGDTYYLALQNAGDPQTNKPGNNPIPAQRAVTGDALFIETSCPCAVYSYDTGNGYKGSDESYNEIVTDGKPLGDPSSVWVAPIQQKIGNITFGTCYTDMTKNHFLNVITETATCQKTTLYAIYGTSNIDKSNSLQWTPVPGNPTYSYARAQIGDASTEKYSVFRLENSHGFIATVYGNGKNESYAYSAGSAAVQQGINVDGTTYTHESRGETKLPVNSIIHFDSEVGTDEITRVDWDFGDGITENGLGVSNGLVQNTHVYTSPGWYEVTAHLFGHQVCTDESEQDLGTITFTIHVAKPDTTFKYVNSCIPEDESKPKIGVDIIYDDTDFSNVIATIRYFVQESSSYDTITASDLDTVPLAGKEYYVDPANPIYTYDVDSTLPFPNIMGCDSIIHYHIKFATCLDIELQNDDGSAMKATDTLSICCYDPLEITYKQIKGDVKNQGTTSPLFYAYWVCNNKTSKIEVDNLNAGSTASITLPTEDLKPGHYDATLYFIDENCNNRATKDTLNLPIHLDVQYADSIFRPKFGNTLVLYKKGYGGNSNPGWEFTAFQWYHNNQAIEGATEAVYYAPADSLLNGEYYVELTRKGESKPLRSCSQCFKDGWECNDPNAKTTSNENNSPNAAQKRLQNRQILILRDGHTYNIYGQKIQ